MQATAQFPCSSIIPSSHHPQCFSARIQLSRAASPSWVAQYHSLALRKCLRFISPIHSTATEEIAETDKSGLEFVEVGYVASAHGLRGEISIKAATDFPELRFLKPGKRWLRRPGKDVIQEVKLVEGRGHGGKKGWILRFDGVDTVDQAKQLVGSTLLVRDDDRPELEEGEFYTRDLVGMKVILKETSECVGTVIEVFNSGASDLLRVRLSSGDVLNGTKKSKKADTSVPTQFAWIPFVEAIVPDVDMNKREMHITPPEGLLELNIRLDERSKKERRQLEWTERKKFQRRLIAAKKKLSEMEQKHVFHGLRYGEKSQRRLLADQIAGVNSKLLQQALKSLEKPIKRLSATELVNTARIKVTDNSLKIPMKCVAPNASKEHFGENFNLKEKGDNLLAEGKVAVVLTVNGFENGRETDPDLVDSDSGENLLFSSLEESLLNNQTFIKTEDRMSLPLVLVSPGQDTVSLEMLFSDNDYFGFDPDKVWFLPEEKLPVVNSSVELQSKHKILMKSPWEILQSPVGSGGLIGSLGSHNILEDLGKLGVEYIEISSASQKHPAGNPLLLGFVDSRKAETGVQIFEDTKDSEESFDMIFSLNFAKLLAKQIDKLRFDAVPKANVHVEMADKEWIDVIPTSPNSYEFRCSIYSSLNACPRDKICLLEVTD